MFEFAYNEIVEDSAHAMRARERMALDQVIAMLRDAAAKGPRSVEAVKALYQLRLLWSVFLGDLENPDNALPESLRARIISIGIWMNKEIDRLRSGVCTDLTPIIEINEIIRDGLT
ncbi:MAG: flagellar biosynthesis regulator FlaF [Roseiarcus sp.]